MKQFNQMLTCVKNTANSISFITTLHCEVSIIQAIFNLQYLTFECGDPGRFWAKVTTFVRL